MPRGAPPSQRPGALRRAEQIGPSFIFIRPFRMETRRITARTPIRRLMANGRKPIPIPILHRPFQPGRFDDPVKWRARSDRMLVTISPLFTFCLSARWARSRGSVLPNEPRNTPRPPGTGRRGRFKVLDSGEPQPLRALLRGGRLGKKPT